MPHTPLTTKEALQQLVNYLDQDPDLYDGDDDGVLRRVMNDAYQALTNGKEE